MSSNVRCPDWPNPDSDEPDLMGCGSTNIDWDGEVWDCLDCGLFFTSEAGTPPPAYEIVRREATTFREVNRDPIEVYGTPEHEAWLIECERNEP